MKDKVEYRIEKQDGTIKYTGTGEDSWFTIEEARLKVDYSKGERIVMSDGVHILCEAF